jgi:hypothetical protein
VIMRGATFSQMVEEERSRLVEQQIEEVEDSEWYRFRVIQTQWYPQTPPVHLWTKDCQLRKSKARRLTLAPIEEEGNLADVMFQKDDTPMQLEEDATQLEREKSRYGSMELMNSSLSLRARVHPLRRQGKMKKTKVWAGKDWSRMSHQQRKTHMPKIWCCHWGITQGCGFG